MTNPLGVHSAVWAREAGEWLGHVHMGESHRGLPGTGTIGFPAFFGALADVGYTGPLTFESFAPEVVGPDLAQGLAVWGNPGPELADADELAIRARQFIAEGIGVRR
ncbi:TIM barrel protein [Streptomyces sp. NPDC001904]|uniref:TIM barrel protein n=1 Tax=Streptomyces sp. NPDC001904 TaxID=3154531 RepID=UPI00331B3BD3